MNMGHTIPPATIPIIAMATTMNSASADRNRPVVISPVPGFLAVSVLVMRGV